MHLRIVQICANRGFPAFGHFTFHFDVMVGQRVYSNQSFVENVEKETSDDINDIISHSTHIPSIKHPRAGDFSLDCCFSGETRR